MELIRTPKDMDELYELIKDMRGTQADLARVAIMALSIGHREGYESGKSFVFGLVGPGLKEEA